MRAAYEPPTDARAYRFCHRVRVRFGETDAMGVVHHAAYLAYLEAARVEFLRAVGHPFGGIREEGLELPVAEVAVRYLRPLVFDDEVDVHLAVTSARGATFELGYLVALDGEPRATAVTVHAVLGRGGRPIRCPEWLVSLVSEPSPASR
ncbi:MAG TPA: thioesterase family protein [Acidimicrobiales bacterium]|nr:thioesterase family protein [Acidimicrobiales bacterium]